MGGGGEKTKQNKKTDASTDQLLPTFLLAFGCYRFIHTRTLFFYLARSLMQTGLNQRTKKRIEGL